MSKFCTGCGAQLNDDAVFCPSCGTKITQDSVVIPNPSPAPAQPTYTQNYQQPQYSQAPYSYPPVKRKGNPGVIIAIVVGVVVVISIIVGVFIATLSAVNKPKSTNGGIYSGSPDSSAVAENTGDYKKPVNEMYAGWQNGSWNQFVSAYPKFLTDIFTAGYKGLGYTNGDDFVEEYLYTPISDEVGKNFKMTLTFSSQDKLSQTDINDYNDKFNNDYSANVKITEAYKLKFSITVKGDDSKLTDTDTAVVGKIDGKWYVIDDSLIQGFESSYNARKNKTATDEN